MATIWITSDTHFGQASFLKYRIHVPECPAFGLKHAEELALGVICDCPKMRDFPSVEAMDEHIISQWNSVVNPSHHVYHLGDVAMKWQNIAMVGRCNGHKRLIPGNHDIYATKKYLPFFEEIMGMRVFDDMILTHIPMHPESVKPKWTNVHGHVHNNVTALHYGPQYLNVSTEVTDYRPLSLEEVRQRIKEQREENQRIIEANLSRLGIKKRWTHEELHSPPSK